MLNGVGKVGLGIAQAVKTCLLPAIMPIKLGHTLIRGKPKANDEQGIKDVCDDIKKLVKGSDELLSNSEIAAADEEVSLITTICIARLGKKLDNIKAQGRELTMGEEGTDGYNVLTTFMKDSQEHSFMNFFKARCGQNLPENEIAKVTTALSAPAA